MNISADTIRRELEKRIRMVNVNDIKEIINGNDRLSKIMENRRLKKFASDITLLMSLLRSYFSGEYREIPWGVLATILATLLYVLSPLDLIPDFILGVGLLDDALMVALCIKMVGSDLDNYKEWKNNNPELKPTALL